jgi:hypothetical protein
MQVKLEPTQNTVKPQFIVLIQGPKKRDGYGKIIDAGAIA